MNNTTLDNLLKIALELEQEKGEMRLFALFLRTDLLQSDNVEKWDLLIGADWISDENKPEIELSIFDKLIKGVGGDTIENFLQKLVLFSADSDFLDTLTEYIGYSDTTEPKENFTIPKTEIDIQKAYFLISRPINSLTVQAVQ